MKFSIAMISMLLSLALLTSCASSLSSAQQHEYKSWESRGLTIQEKSPGGGVALGLLPGGGSFYTRHYGIGVVNLLFWPLSILWDTVNGYNGSLSINYYATKADIETKKRKELQELEDLLITNDITQDIYIIKKREIERRYDP